MTRAREMPDQERFVTGLRGGDRDVLAWIEARCERVAGPQFSAWAWEWVRDDFGADLVAQLASATRAEAFELRGDAGAYVDTSIRNLCRRYFSELARTRASSPLAAAGEVPSPGARDSLSRVAAAVDLKRALDRLSPECRRLILSKYVHGQSLDEIGDELGIGAKTARSRLHTCRQKLRELWEE